MYDLCEVIEGVRSLEDRGKLFPRAAKTTAGKSVLRGRYRFGDQTFSVQSLLGGGEYGRVMKGTFGTRPVVIKRNVDVELREDVNETIVQTRLHCFLRDKGYTQADVARVPEAIFAAFVPGFGRVLGMEGVESSLLDRVERAPASSQVALLRDALLKVCRLLIVLQKEFRFMHGDLHGENVMTKGSDVYVIDFGMSSARFKREPRMVTSERYDGVRFHSQLDLLTLITSLREDLGLSKHRQAAAWCDSYVGAFWTTVREGLWSGKRGKLPFGARRTVKNATEEIQRSGEVYYAHHLLYEEIGRVSFPPCEPANLLRLLQSDWKKKPPPLTRERFFEDV